MLDPILFWMMNKVSQQQIESFQKMNSVYENHSKSRELMLIMKSQHEEIYSLVRLSKHVWVITVSLLAANLVMTAFLAYLLGIR